MYAKDKEKTIEQADLLQQRLKTLATAICLGTQLSVGKLMLDIYEAWIMPICFMEDKILLESQY